jgi:DNA repair protein RecO (recombination protein O)
MPLHESDSIILKTYPLAEADRIIVFFSREYGKVRGVANGVRRLKSRFGAALEPLARSNISFFRKENRELVRIRSSELIDSPMKLFEDYDRAVLAGHVAELVDKFLPDHEVQDAVFRLFELARRALISGCDLGLVRCYFEVWMLRLAGVFPDVFTCATCMENLGIEKDRVFLPGLTSVACGRCAGNEGTEVPPPTISALTWILTTPLVSDIAGPEQVGLDHLRQLNKIWIERYFER